MINIAVCDDEEHFRKQIHEMIIQYMKNNGFYYNIDCFPSGKALLELGIELNRYQIIFLDVNMDEVDGLMTAKRIREQNTNVFIVFVTAFVKYSMDGYKVDAVRFLLKNSQNMQEHINECMDTIHHKMNYEATWKEFKFNEGKKRISLDNLLFVESRLHKLEFHIMTEYMTTYTMYDTLNNIQEYIGSNDFLRCHQSFLVNMKYIKKICHYKVFLYNDISFPIPKAKYRDVHDAYIAYKGEV